MFRKVFALWCILIIIYVMLSLRPYRISGDSMEPALMSEKLIWINTTSIHMYPPGRGEVIVYQPLDAEPRVKRIIGLPGETVVIEGGQVKIDDAVLVEPYLMTNLRTCMPGSCIDLAAYTFVVPENAYFVLGDNRENSRDSRGCVDALRCSPEAAYYVSRDDIVGKSIFAY